MSQRMCRDYLGSYEHSPPAHAQWTRLLSSMLASEAPKGAAGAHLPPSVVRPSVDPAIARLLNSAEERGGETEFARYMAGGGRDTAGGGRDTTGGPSNGFDAVAYSGAMEETVGHNGVPPGFPSRSEPRGSGFALRGEPSGPGLTPRGEHSGLSPRGETAWIPVGKEYPPGLLG